MADEDEKDLNGGIGLDDDQDVDPDFLDKDPEDYDSEEEEEDKAEDAYLEDGYQKIDFYDNLAPHLTPQQRDKIVSKYMEYFERDKEDREERDKQYKEGIQRTGVSNDAPGGADFNGASRAVHPGLAEACVDFGSRSMKELFPPSGPVRIDIQGKMTKAKIDRAERKRRHMNWQFTKDIAEYRSVLEQVLTQVPLGGAQFIKWYPHFLKKRPGCEFVRIDNIFFPVNSPDFYNASRVFHDQYISEHEFNNRVRSGLYSDLDIVETATGSVDGDRTQTQEQMDKTNGVSRNDAEDEDCHVIDVYAFDDFEEEDGDADPDLSSAPYLLSIDVRTKKLVGMYRNWLEDDKKQEKINYVVKFGFIPWDGPLEIGLPHLIGSLSGAATGSLRALLDAALASNIPAGVILKGAGVTGQTHSIGPARLTEITMRGGTTDDINKIFQHIPFSPPSPTLLGLLQFIDGKIAGMVRTSSETSDDNQNMPVGTKLANIEQAMTVYSAIHQRLHASQMKCLEIVHLLNRLYMDESAEYDEELGFATKEDYQETIDVQPVSDPNVFSESQRFGQLQAALQLNEMFPNLMDQRALLKWAFTLMKIANPEEILPDPDKPTDHNPVAENIMMALGQPAIALPDQDHLAHLQVHLDFTKSPQFGQNPVFTQAILPQEVLHLKQHLLYYYGALFNQTIEKALGVPLDKIQDEDPIVTQKFSQLVATASPQVMQEIQPILAGAMEVIEAANAKIQQWQQQQQSQNPVMTDLQIKQQDVQNKAQDAQAKTSLAQQELQEKQRADSQEMAIAQQKINAEMQKTQEDNQTALDISSMRSISGQGMGGFKNGESLG